MDKLTIISGCLFLAADIFAIASIANPDWINTGESAGALTVGLVRQCQTIHGRDRTCIPPRLPPESLPRSSSMSPAVSLLQFMGVEGLLFLPPTKPKKGKIYHLEMPSPHPNLPQVDPGYRRPWQELLGSCRSSEPQKVTARALFVKNALYCGSAPLRKDAGPATWEQREKSVKTHQLQHQLPQESRNSRLTYKVRQVVHSTNVPHLSRHHISIIDTIRRPGRTGGQGLSWELVQVDTLRFEGAAAIPSHEEPASYLAMRGKKTTIAFKPCYPKNQGHSRLTHKLTATSASPGAECGGVGGVSDPACGCPGSSNSPVSVSQVSWDCRCTPPHWAIETGFHHIGQAGLKLLISSDPPALASQSAGITDRWSLIILPRLVSPPGLKSSSPLASQSAGTTGLSHDARPLSFFFYSMKIHFGRLRWADCFTSAVQDQPGQYGKTMSLQKIQKLARHGGTRLYLGDRGKLFQKKKILKLLQAFMFMMKTIR
ncbi:Modulator of smoothened protein [Plecturocebus cupreus]